MIPIRGGSFLTKLSQQSEGNLQSLKSCLHPLTRDSLDSWEYLPLDSPLWRILQSYCTIIMRFHKFPNPLLWSSYRLVPFSLHKFFLQFLKDTVYLRGIEVYESIISTLSSYQEASSWVLLLSICKEPTTTIVSTGKHDELLFFTETLKYFIF